MGINDDICMTCGKTGDEHGTGKTQVQIGSIGGLYKLLRGLKEGHCHTLRAEHPEKTWTPLINCSSVSMFESTSEQQRWAHR